MKKWKYEIRLMSVLAMYYCAFAFVLLQVNPIEWSQCARLSIVSMCFCTVFLYVCYKTSPQEYQ